MKLRRRNRGLRKICACGRSKWAKCDHPWHFNFKPKGGPAYRFSLDTESDKPIRKKTEAESLGDSIRSAIREGTFRRRAEAPPKAAPPAPDTLTLKAFGQIYFERRGTPERKNDTACLGRLKAFTPPGQSALGETPITNITEDVVELFFASLKAEGRAASTRNKYVQLVKSLFRWATKKGYLAKNPIADSEAIKREKHARRDRRLAPDLVDDKEKVTREGEERRLLAAAGPHLQRLLIGALETGCRRGELLHLQWRDVNLQKRELTVRAETSKTRVGRVLPVSARLAAVLEMAQSTLAASLPESLKPDEKAKHVATCYVFGDAAGLRVANIKRAWETAVLKAHGYTPAWADQNKLGPESRAALKVIDLHFHDLRHEAGSRLLEAGWPLHHVQHMLGHANVSQTSTYLNATRIGLQESMHRFSVRQLPADQILDQRPQGGELRQAHPRGALPVF